MKRRIISLLIISFFLFVFIIFYQSLNKSSFYKPTSKIKDIPQFVAKSLSSQEEISSKKIFYEDKYYLLNIWASWCVPCRDEHPFLMNLSNQKNIEIIGLNYKDDIEKAKIFLNQFGNPFKEIFLDTDGTIAIEWGAYGVPETFLIYDKKIIKKIIGPLNENLLWEIKKLIK